MYTALGLSYRVYGSEGFGFRPLLRCPGVSEGLGVEAFWVEGTGSMRSGFKYGLLVHSKMKSAFPDPWVACLAGFSV